MATRQHTYGIEGQQAPELSKDIRWINGQGDRLDPIQLSDYENQFKILYGFQSWCPGCHSRGLPALQKMTSSLQNNDKISFFALQTVFEGQESNTFEKMVETQKKYELEIPFGHDIGNDKSHNKSTTMYHYRTGGTPWFIFIDQNNKVIFNDYHLNVDKAIEFLKEIN